MGLPGVYWLQVVPATFVIGQDPAATARRIEGGMFLFRLGLLSALLSNVGFLLLALNLYELFRDVDRRQARLLVALVSISVALAIANEVNAAAPLALLGGSHAFDSFTRPQLEALAAAFLRLHGLGIALNAAFWGLWLFPFGVLVWRSGFLPKILGACLMVGVFAYLATCIVAVGFPEHRRLVSAIVLPLYAVAELPIAIWFLVKGVPRPHEARRAARPAPLVA